MTTGAAAPAPPREDPGRLVPACDTLTASDFNDRELRRLASVAADVDDERLAGRGGGGDDPGRLVPAWDALTAGGVIDRELWERLASYVADEYATLAGARKGGPLAPPWRRTTTWRRCSSQRRAASRTRLTRARRRSAAASVSASACGGISRRREQLVVDVGGRGGRGGEAAVAQRQVGEVLRLPRVDGELRAGVPHVVEVRRELLALLERCSSSRRGPLKFRRAMASRRRRAGARTRRGGAEEKSSTPREVVGVGAGKDFGALRAHHLLEAPDGPLRPESRLLEAKKKEIHERSAAGER